MSDKRYYTCAECGETHENSLTDEEMVEQLSREFPGYTMDDPHAIVCDDCYQKFYGTAH